MSVIKDKGKKYTAEGAVIGDLYSSTNLSIRESVSFNHHDLEIMKEMISQRFETNTLDDGYGFNSITGALMKIVIIHTLELDNKDYVNNSSELMQLGNITKEDLSKLENFLL